MNSPPNTSSSSLGPATRGLLAAAAFVILIAGVRAISDSVINPLLLALFITIIVSPILEWASSKGFSTGTAILVILSTLLLASLFAIVLLGTSLQQFAVQLPEYARELGEKEREAYAWLEEQGWLSDDQEPSQLLNAEAAVKLLGQLINGLIGTLGKSVIILVLVGFMLAEMAWLPAKIRGASQDSQRAMDQAVRIAENIRRYIAIKTLVSLLTGLIVAVGTALLGVPYWIVWGFLAFLLNYIPNIGSIIAAIPAIIVAFLAPREVDFGFASWQLSGIWAAILTSALYVFVNQLFGSFVEPRWQGRGLGLSPLVVFTSLLFWGWVLGPIGMLLSAPLTMAVKIALEGYDDTYWLSILLGGKPTEQTTEAPADQPPGGAPATSGKAN